MANLLNVLSYMAVDIIRQRSNAERLAHMHIMGAYNVLAPARTLQHGATMNEIRGTTPFAVANASRGMGTVARRTGHPLIPGASPTIYTALPPAPRRRRRRARR
jgi:hypothetical protein